MNGWMDLFTGAGVVTAIGIVRWRTLFNTRVYLWPGTSVVFSCPLLERSEQDEENPLMINMEQEVELWCQI